MNKNNKSVATSPRMGQLRYWLPLLTLVFFGNAWGDCSDIDHKVDFDACNSQSECTYAMKPGADDTTFTFNIPEIIEAKGTSLDTSNVTWIYGAPSIGNTCSGTNYCDSSNKKCFEDGSNSVTINDSGDPATFSGTATTGVELDNGCFRLTAAGTDDSGAKSCGRDYKLHFTADGGGWGDPHITTVDGVHYDFQSAGEFTALRGNGVEIQTRQTAVATSHVPGPNAYTEIASCVSIYTAVAAQVGSHTVTIQPNLSGEPDPSGMQLRVDGKLRVLGPDGIDLAPCNCDSDETPGSGQQGGRIVKSADDKGFEIRYADGTKLVVTPAWWAGQQKWYLNINVYDTTATKGIMGRITEGWLPALSNGKSVGRKAENPDQRYEQLYKKFADSWRVSDENSLFYYEDGTSTETFTLAGWPKPNENPRNCLIAGSSLPVPEPVDESVAEEHCRGVEDENNRANCIFDVAATGHSGFADAYVRAEQVTPGATKTSVSVDKASSRPGTKVTFTAVVMRKVSTIAKVTSGRVQFVLDGKAVGDPMAFDTNGNALWSTSSLQRGTHEIEARFLPSGFGEQFRTSNSPKVSHTVSMLGQLSFHLGTNVPHGSLSNDFDGDIGYAFDYEYRLSNSYSLLVFAGKNQFDSSTAELDITNLSINGKHYYGRLAKRRLRYFANGGIGFYMADPGDDDLGVNIGGGVQYQLAAGYGLEAWYNYHHIFSSPSSTDFSTLQFGGYYHF